LIRRRLHDYLNNIDNDYGGGGDGTGGGETAVVDNDILLFPMTNYYCQKMKK
jgi:hypothetical protein